MFTNSVCQEVSFIGACQNLMLSKPLHDIFNFPTSSETLGVKLSAIGSLNSLKVQQVSGFSKFQTYEVS